MGPELSGQVLSKGSALYLSGVWHPSETASLQVGITPNPEVSIYKVPRNNPRVDTCQSA
jgi:hypothetical protein